MSQIMYKQYNIQIIYNTKNKKEYNRNYFVQAVGIDHRL